MQISTFTPLPKKTVVITVVGCAASSTVPCSRGDEGDGSGGAALVVTREEDVGAPPWLKATGRRAQKRGLQLLLPSYGSRPCGVAAATPLVRIESARLELLSVLEPRSRGRCRRLSSVPLPLGRGLPREAAYQTLTFSPVLDPGRHTPLFTRSDSGPLSTTVSPALRAWITTIRLELLLGSPLHGKEAGKEAELHRPPHAKKRDPAAAPDLQIEAALRSSPSHADGSPPPRLNRHRLPLHDSSTVAGQGEAWTSVAARDDGDGSRLLEAELSTGKTSGTGVAAVVRERV